MKIKIEKVNFEKLFFPVSAVFILSLLSACGGSGNGGNNSNNNGNSSSSLASQYQLNADAQPGGSISPAKLTISKGDSASFTIAPDNGFTIAAVTGCNGSLNGTAYVVNPVVNDCNIFVTFSPIKSTITIQVENGKTIPEGTFEITTGENLNLTVIPDVGYRSAALNLTGNCSTINTRLRDFDIRANGGNCNISVNFSCRDENIDNICDRQGSALIVHHSNISPAVVRQKDIANTEFTITADLAGDFDSVWVEMWMSKIDPDNYTPKKILLTQDANNPHLYSAKLGFDPEEIKALNSFGGHVGYIGNSYIRASRAGETLGPENFSGGSSTAMIVVIDDEIPDAPLEQLSTEFYANDYLLHVVDPHYHRITDLNALSAKVLQVITEPDFLIAIPTGTSPVGDWSYYYSVFNDVTGIGTNTFDSRSAYGAKQSLQGYINIGQFGYDFSHFLHEIGHRWGFYLSDNKLKLTETLCNCHREVVGTEAGNMGISPTIIIEQPDGSFSLGNPTKEQRFKYSSIEKYLMGIINFQEVADSWFVKPELFTNASSFKKEELMQVNGTLLHQTYGSRIPDANNSPKHFSVNFFTVGPNPLTEAEAAYFSYVAKYQGEDHSIEADDFSGVLYTYPTFSVATGGVMRLDTKIRVLPKQEINMRQLRKLTQEKDALSESIQHRH